MFVIATLFLSLTTPLAAAQAAQPAVDSLRGVNFHDPVLMAKESESPESDPEYVNRSMVMLRDYGFNVIRVPYQWEAYVSNPDLFLAEAELVASLAEENGIYVFFDFHHWFASSYFNNPWSGFPSFLLSSYATGTDYDTVAKPFWTDFWNNSLIVNGKSV